MGKLPTLDIDVDRYLADTRHLSLAARGAWSDLLMFLHRTQSRGTITNNMVGYARLLGVSSEQGEQVINELLDSRVCDYKKNDNGEITIKSRRMLREEKKKENNRLRQASYRCHAGDNEEKTSKRAHGTYLNVFLSDVEYGKLGERFGEGERNLWIKKLDEGIELKGYKYQSHYLAILKWSELEKNKQQSQPKTTTDKVNECRKIRPHCTGEAEKENFCQMCPVWEQARGVKRTGKVERLI